MLHDGKHGRFSQVEPLNSDSTPTQGGFCLFCAHFPTEHVRKLLVTLGHADIDLDQEGDECSVDAVKRHSQAYDAVLAEARRLALNLKDAFLPEAN
jgi:hypothetical protein